MAKLPLAIRNWDDLLSLVPGVQSDRYTEQAGGTSAGRTGGVSVHGNRSLQNNFLLDGVANNSFSTNVQELTTQLSRPSVDAIGEFKVVTSPYAAEYGWSPGAAIIVSTKSGSNALHGTAYDFFRNDSLDSNNYFAERANQPKPTNNQNQFGGNLGGPVVKNRVFFFGDVEATRIEQGVLRTGRVLTADERRGVFSTAIRDPLTGANFPNNTIPGDRIDPVAARVMAMLPSPNAAGNNNYINQPNVEDESERYLARVDVPFGNDNVFARYIYSDRFRYVPGFLGGILDGTSTSAWGRNYLSSHAIVGGWTKVINPRFFNEFRLSYGRGTNDGTQDPFGEDGNAQIGFRGVPNDPRVVGGIVGMDVSGHVRLGSPNFMPKFQHTEQMQFLNTLTWLAGRHQVKFGADVMAPMNNEYFDVAPTRGNLAFNGQFTGNGLRRLRARLRPARAADQRVRRRAAASVVWCLRAGRLESDRRLHGEHRRCATTTCRRPPKPTTGWPTSIPAAGALVFASDGSLEQRALVNPDKNNFSPRLGAIYQAGDRTIVRGGFGIFYNQFDRIGSEDQLALNPPGLANIDVQSAGGSTVPDPAPAGRLPAEFPRSGEHQRRAHHGARRGSRQPPHRSAAVRRRRRAAARRKFRGLRGFRRLDDQPSRGAAQHQPAATRHA